MEQIKKAIDEFRYKGIIGVTLIFALIACILFLERSGIDANYQKSTLTFLPKEEVFTKHEVFQTLPKNTLVLHTPKRDESVTSLSQFSVILSDMKVGYDSIDVTTTPIPSFYNYESVILLLPDLESLGDDVITLCEYVRDGGNVLFANTLEKSIYTSVLESKLGIVDSSYTNTEVGNIYLEPGFMIGGGRTFTIDDPFESSRAIQLSSEHTTVYAHTDDERKLPLIWESRYGKGKFIVTNLGMYGKVMRGFYAASYSLMTDISVYPVINGSVFYLDDFPSQIPSGNNDYIWRDFKTSTRDFYTNIWWPDMMNIAEKYGIRYTGLAIESYDDITDGTTDAIPDKGTFLNFGNMLLRMGGELGYHGYNHQPLCFDECDYGDLYDYKTWKSESAAESAFDELIDLCDELFSGVEMSVYVPPSNIMSKEGQKFLRKKYPHIKTISGIYLPDEIFDHDCIQEFEAYKNGTVDQPRVVSGCKLTPFMELALVSELNFHYINSHFTHPDDALDPERGAMLGWKKLYSHFDEYLSWLYSSSPGLRNLTGSEMSAAVQRYAAIGVTKEFSENTLTLSLSNFYDEAYLMLRFNEYTPDKVSGGSLTNLTGNLYLLKANSDIVTISVSEE